MTKRKLVQFGIVGIVILGVVVFGFFAYHKGGFLSKADTLGIQSQNLTATIPFVANDVSRDYWAYNYIDAVTKRGSGKLTAENPNLVIMENYIAGQDGIHQGGDKFYPDELMDRRWGVFYLSRALNIQPCFGCTVSFADVSPSDWFGLIWKQCGVVAILTVMIQLTLVRTNLRRWQCLIKR